MSLFFKQFVVIAVLSIVFFPAPILAADCTCVGTFTLGVVAGQFVSDDNFNLACTNNGGRVTGSGICDFNTTITTNPNLACTAVVDQLTPYGTFDGPGCANSASSNSQLSTPGSPAAAPASAVKGKNCPDGVTDRICLENPLGTKIKASEIIQTIISGALGIVGALALFMLVLGGFKWLTSAGNAERVELCDEKLCDEKLCDEKLCDEKLCDEKLCDEKLCDDWHPRKHVVY